MRRPQKDIQLTTYDDLLSISEIDDTGMDRVIEVPLAELFPFKNHGVYDYDSGKDLSTSVQCLMNGTIC